MKSVRMFHSLRAALSVAVLALGGCGGSGGGGGGAEVPGPAPVPVLSVFAGALQPATGSRDGVGAAALFNRPGGVTQDAAGTVYVADTGNHTIRKITSQGVVTTFAGAAGQAGSADGSGAAARFRSPQGLSIDAAGFVYVADTGNHTVRKISPAGVVTTVAGVAGQSGSTDGSNAAARLNAPTKLALDAAGTLYVLSDTAVRKVAPDGSVSTFPILPRAATAPFAFVILYSGIAVDAAGNVFVSDYPSAGGGDLFSANAGSIRKFNPQGQPITADPAAQRMSEFVLPRDIALDADGNLDVVRAGYFAVSAGRFPNFRHVQRIAVDGALTTLAGPESEGRNAMTVDGPVATARFADPVAISVAASGRIVVVEASTGAVRVIAQGFITTLAGGNGGGYLDGAGPAARFSAPAGLAAASDGTLYVVETGNRSLRRITPAGQVSTVRAPDTLSLPFNVAVGANGAVVVTDTSLLNICDGSAYSVNQIAAGPVGVSRFVPYNGSVNAHALAIDAQGNLVVNETAQVMCGLRSDKPTQIAAYALDGSKRVLATGIEATALAADAAGRVYFATAQGTVGSLDPSGQIQIRAGVAGQLGDQDGSAADARFRAITALALDAAGNLYVADGTRIRKIRPAGLVTTIADLSNADGADAATHSIGGLAWVSGALYATFQQAVIRIALE